MIYLIGGAPRAGKTTLAKALAYRLRISWVSVDTLEGIVRRGVPKKYLDKVFPKNRLRRLTSGTNDKLYTHYSPVTIVKAYLDQGRASELAVEDFVEDCVHEGHDFIVEGYQVHPRLAARLIKRHPRDIKAVFLEKHDIPAMVRGFKKNHAASDWVLDNTTDMAVLAMIARMLELFGKVIEKEAGRYDLSVCNMDRGYHEAIRKLVRQLSGRG